MFGQQLQFKPCPRQSSPQCLTNRGYSYVEVLVAMVLVATSLAPMVESINAALNHQTNQSQVREQFIYAQDRLAGLVAEPYSALDVEAQATGSATSPTSYSDGAGISPRALVFLTRFDVDNADGDNNNLTGGDSGLLWVRVAIEDTNLDFETLVVAP